MAKLGGFLVGHVPEGVAFLAEVFETDPHGVVDVLDQVRAPVVEDLQTADLVARILHVNPTIRHDRRVAEGRNVGGVGQAQVLDEQADGDEIAVRQAVGDFGHILRSRLVGGVHGVDKVLDRHGRNEVVRGHFGAVAFGILVHDGCDLAVLLAISTTLASVMTFTPAASQLDSTVSHSWPGPSFGYQNSSMREVRLRSCPRFFGRSFWKAFFSTPMMLRPLTRCAPQSAEISDG